MKKKISLIFFLFFLITSFSQTTLPINRTTWNGTTPIGWTDSGTGSYTSAFACSTTNGGRLDSSSDYYQVYFDSTPDQLDYVLKISGSSTSSLLVEESANGSTWTTIVNDTSLPTICTPYNYTLIGTTRYFSWTYNKTSQNVNIDDINITAGAAPCTPTQTITSFAPSSGPELSHITITGTGFTASSTIDFNGTAATIISQTATQLVVETPVGVTTGVITVTEASCSLDTTTDFTVLSGTCSGGGGGIPTGFTDLMFSGIYDDQTESCHYFELLNPTTSAIDLTDYTIGLDNNFTLPSAVPIAGFSGGTLALTGTLAAETTIMIRLSASGTCTSCPSVTPDLSFTSGGINDDDRLVLVKDFGTGSATAQDVWQNHSTPGAGYNVGYVFTRDLTATAPSATFLLSDWVNDGNEDCFGFAITVVPAPTIDTQPLDIDDCNLTDVNLSASASGSGTLTYQWKYNDGSATGWTDVISTSFSPGIVTGETSTNLSVSGFNLDGYQFFCEATEPAVCSVATDAIQVTMKNTIWDGSTWSNGAPDITTLAEINGDYTTAINGSFSACSLIINNTRTLTIDDNTFVEIENNTTVDGALLVNTQGAFVQNNDLATFTNVSGTSTVTKRTAPAEDWLEYTYWSSPVQGETIGSALSPADSNRRFRFRAENYRDSAAETNNDGILVNGFYDDEDDNGNDWLLMGAGDTMLPAVGYAATLSSTSFSGPGSQIAHIFTGEFNNGVYPVTIYKNVTETNDNNWNFIGNPYPSAISLIDFLDENEYSVTNTAGNIDGVIYFWSHQNPPSSTVNGNSQNNFSQSDYAMRNRVAGVAGGDNNGDGIVDMLDEPDGFIPSGQGFFVSYNETASSTLFSNALPEGTVNEGTVTFRNAMRTTGNNNQFFRNSNPPSDANKLWLYLSSDTGVSSQIAIGYVANASDGLDGASYDAVRNLSIGNNTFLYSTIANNSDNFAIQGKAPESLTLDEVITLGLYTTITNPVIYSISISHFEGDFFTNNTIYLKDNFTSVIHDLNASDYSFTSNSGEFRDRFEIVFKTSNLSVDGFNVNENDITIIELQNDNVKFTVPNTLSIKTVKIIDVLGRELYNFRGSENTEIYNLSNLSSAPYIAQITLSNEKVITKKVIKK